MENEEKRAKEKGKKEDFGQMSGFTKLMIGKLKDVNIANLLKTGKEIGRSKTHFTVKNLIFLKKAIRKLKGAVLTQSGCLLRTGGGGWNCD